MPDRAQLANASSTKIPSMNVPFTMQRLWRQALWGSAAAAAVLVAVLASRSDVGSQRVGLVLSSLTSAPSSSGAGRAAPQIATQVPPRTPDADVVTRQLAQTVRGLAEDRDRIMTRLTAVERNIDDMTGSITRQIEAAKATTGKAPPPPWPNDQMPVPMTPMTISSLAASAAPSPSALAALPPANPPTRETETPASVSATSEPPAAAAAAPAAPPGVYGADLGGGSSIKALQTRWSAIHAAYPQFFVGLKPVVALKDGVQSKRTELRLVVGPFASAARAAQLCASLVGSHLFCQPTMFDSRQLALQ